MNRITTIIGAGAPLDFDYESVKIMRPSTYNITKEIINNYDLIDVENINKTKTSDLVKEIYDCLEKQYPVIENWKEEDDNKETIINFEMIFHVLESLYAYGSVWSKTCKNPSIYPIFAPFIKPSIIFDKNDIRQILDIFTIRIMDIINSYNKYFAKEKENKEKWYYKFFSRKKVIWDIFNLNYDTTIETCINNYKDGFERLDDENFMKFNPKILWDSETSTINHLHGCINYYFDSYKDINKDIFNSGFYDLYKYNSYDKVRGMILGRGRSYPSNQTGESYYPSPIITGLRKTDKVTNFPLGFYYGNLLKSIINNNVLVIIGYSFGDLYINSLLEKMNTLHGDSARIVIIDFWNKNKIKKQGLEHYFGYCLPNEELRFILKISNEKNASGLNKNLNCSSNKAYMMSNNNKLMLFINGFKKASKYANKIFDFMNS